MKALEVSSLTASYGKGAVVHGIDLVVGDAEIVVLLGANGAGKTTVLRAISGMIARTGSVVYFGTDISKSRTEKIAQSGLAHVPQGRGVLGALTVDENLRLGVYGRGNKGFRREAVAGVYEAFPRLVERQGLRAGSLSGGEQQMLALGRAFACRPKLLLVDEPSLGLSPKISAEVFDAIDSLRSQFGTSCLVVEQNARAVLRFADRGYVLSNGEITLTDTAENLANQPAVQRAYLGV